MMQSSKISIKTYHHIFISQNELNRLKKVPQEVSNHGFVESCWVILTQLWVKYRQTQTLG